MDKILKDKKDLNSEVERLSSLLASAEARHEADLTNATEKHKKELKVHIVWKLSYKNTKYYCIF